MIKRSTQKESEHKLVMNMRNIEVMPSFSRLQGARCSDHTLIDVHFLNFVGS